VKSAAQKDGAPKRGDALARVIAITNQKGGVGKTTTAINLAASLAAAEVQTLLVDCDPQSNATSGIGVPRDLDRANLYEALTRDKTADELIVKTEVEGLDVLPASRDLVGINIELATLPDRELRLREALRPVRSHYTFVVIDCPPALDLLTLNALVAADALIIPMLCEYFALEGIAQLLETVDAVRAHWNPSLEIEGVLFTQFGERTNLSRQVAESLRGHFGDAIFRTSIPRNVRLAEAPSYGKPALIYDVRSRGAEAYIQLAKEVIEHERSRYAAQSLRAGA
jgi:chromosome partitioning protein